ncbi:hypothetical protein OS493_018992 [Desmophyllum pertusum]|uniref:C-type lectin domain-containing protein n=1 Tax=Desmophyllum pertusum TaxID=174260 RepID=A0A9W9YZW8_9CNID|nr:hypothetical protein OS493_018992 [Desmophyllum pertusum]
MILLNWRENIVVVLLICNTLPTKSDGKCKYDRPQQVVFTQRVQDHVLTGGHIVSTTLVSSDKDCQMKCIVSMKCDLFNLGPLDDSFRHTCQILRFGVHSYIAQRKNGWMFRARKNGGICFSIDGGNTPKCACLDRWKGQTCSVTDFCKAGWTKYKRSFFKVSEGKSTFNQANSSCISEGAGLVWIEDFDELHFLDTILEKDEKVFVGMTDIAEEGQWVWMDGSAPKLNPLWHGKHPKGGTSKNCGEYKQKHGFHAKKCDDTLKYVCKYSLDDM